MPWFRKKQKETAPEPPAQKTILEEIVETKRREVEALAKETTYDALRQQALEAGPVRDFKGAISQPGRINIIAEVKKASPSKGIIREDFDPVAIAKDYAAHGASALSVLTDGPYFQGSLDYLKPIREAVDLPILRKDFIIDPIQIPQARVAGADAVFFIAAIWGDYAPMRELVAAANDCGMPCFIEVHTREELEMAYACDVDIIGINNRNLKTFETDLNNTFYVSKLLVSEAVLISESGIQTADDLIRLREGGVNAALVGEHLMRQPSPGKALAEMLAGVNPS